MFGTAGVVLDHSPLQQVHGVRQLYYNKVLILNTNLVTQISCHITLYLWSNYWSNACLNETKYALLLGMEGVMFNMLLIFAICLNLLLPPSHNIRSYDIQYAQILDVIRSAGKYEQEGEIFISTRSD